MPLKDVGRFVDGGLAVGGADPALRAGLSEIIGAIKPEAGLFVLETRRRPVASAICVQDNDLAGLFEVAIDAAVRRQGPSRRIVLSALRWARLRGARRPGCRSKPTTAPAIALYARSASTSLPLSLPARRRLERWIAATKPILLVAACALVDADGRVLLAQRPEGKSLAGLWEFPGGKVEPGETPEETLIRELSEELGIETKVACLAPLTFASHAYEDFHLLMPLYVCRRFWGMPQPLEGQALKWVRPRQLRDYPMPPADEPLIPFLIDLL